MNFAVGHTADTDAGIRQDRWQPIVGIVGTAEVVEVAGTTENIEAAEFAVAVAVAAAGTVDIAGIGMMQPF